jgi:PAS domain S-box-containing protein
LAKVKIGLFVKFFISVSLLIAATSMVLSYFIISYEVATITENLKKRGVVMASTLAYDSEYGVLVGNAGIIKEGIQRIEVEEDVLYAVVYDKGGRVLAATDGIEGAPGTVEAAASSARETLIQLYQSTALGEIVYDIALPIKVAREERMREEIGFPSEAKGYVETIGVVRIGISLSAMNRAVADLTELIRNITAGVIIFGILVTALLVGIITRPLRRLLSGMEGVAKGELNPVDVRTSDEIGEVARTFNKMVEELSKYRRQTEGYSRSLEVKVSETQKTADELKTYSENMIAAMAEGLVAVDTEGTIKMVNRALEELTGYIEGELVGERFIQKLFSGKDRERAIEAMDRARRSGILKEFDLLLNSKDGKEVPVSFNAAGVKDYEGGPQGMVIILHDMTKEREADRLKSEFISTISHELRTPLTSIQGFVSLILQGKVGDVAPKQAEFLKIVQTQGTHLGRLIKNLLDFSRFVTGRMQVEKQRISMKDVIDEVTLAMAALFDEKGMKLEVNLDKNLPEISADAEKIGMVVSNILGNALKFTDRGGTVRISVARSDENVKVEIADTGIGIAKENLDKVFERFFQVDSSLTRKVGGAGIGLAVAREIVLAHGGKIKAESEGLGRGSKFTFLLPIG